jgi:hypothetical protein
MTERQKDRKTERQKDRKTVRQKDRKTVKNVISSYIILHLTYLFIHFQSKFNLPKCGRPSCGVGRGNRAPL